MPEKSEKEHGTSWKTKLCFFTIGFLKQLVTSLAVIAASDILSGTTLPTTLVIAAHVGPYLVITALLSKVIFRLPVLMRLILASLISALGSVVYALESLHVVVKLFGIGLAGVGAGIAELSSPFWSWSAEKERSEIENSYELGGRISSFLGAVYFTGLTALACISSQTALLACALLPLLNIPLYSMTDTNQRTSIQATSHEITQYQLINSNTDVDGSEMSWRERLLTTWNYLPVILSLFVGFSARYVAATSEATTLVFPQSQINPRDHFVFYTLSGMLGEMLGKSCWELFTFCKNARSCVFSRTWDVAIFLILASFVPLFASWYRFLPVIYIVLILMFTCGFLSGVVLSSAFFKLDEVNSLHTKFFLYQLFNIAYSSGIVSGSFLGLFVEPILFRHCIELGRKKEYCLARTVNTTISTSCLI